MSYRQRLKLKNPEKYQKYLDEQKVRSKLYRKKMMAIISKLRYKSEVIPEEKEKFTQYKNAIKLRQMKWRIKRTTQKNDANNVGSCAAVKKENSKKKIPNTRKNIKEQREKWKLAKQRQRAKLSNYQKRWMRQKDKERKQAKKQTDKLIVSPSAFKSKQTLYNKDCITKKTLPQTPEKFAEIIRHMEENASPCKKEALDKLRKSSLDEKFCFLSQIGQNKIETKDVTKSKEMPKPNKNCKPKIEVQKAKQLLHRSLDMLIKTRRRREEAKYRKEVQDFYLSISRPLPNKRYATKHGPGYVLQMTLKSAYRHFRLQYPNAKLGFTKFTLLRPKNVRLLNRAH